MSKGLREIPAGWIQLPNGEYSKRKNDNGTVVLNAQPFAPQLNPSAFDGKTGSKPRIRQDSKPLMNKLESQFHEVLKLRSDLGHIRAQSKRFKLGNGIWYKPDFTTIDLYNQQEIVFEVKGPHAFRGGFENLKVAASLYQEIQWFLVWKEPTGIWNYQTVLP